MPNFVTAMKEEIVRLARKEVKAKGDPLAERLAELRQAVSSLRKELASLAKTVAALKGKVKSDEIISADNVPDQEVGKARLNHRRIAALRRRLGLSRNQMAILLGVNANSIYLWEQGKTRPRAAAKAKLIQLRSLGKRAALKLFKAAMQSKQPAPKAVMPKRKRRLARKAAVAPAAPETAPAPQA